MENIQPYKNSTLKFEPSSIDELINICNIVGSSSCLPQGYYKNAKPDQGAIFMALQLGYSFNLSPLQALQGIIPIRGYLTMKVELILALVQASGLMEYMKEEIRNGNEAFCVIKRKNMDSEIIGSFSFEDAKRANLLHKDNWKNFPTRMLKIRARCYALKDGFSDILNGLNVNEVVEDYNDFEEKKEIKINKKNNVEDRVNNLLLSNKNKTYNEENKESFHNKVEEQANDNRKTLNEINDFLNEFELTNKEDEIVKIKDLIKRSLIKKNINSLDQLNFEDLIKLKDYLYEHYK